VVVPLDDSAGRSRPPHWSPTTNTAGGEQVNASGCWRQKQSFQPHFQSRITGPTDGKLRPTDGKLRPTDGKLRPTDGKLRPTDGKLRPTDGKLRPNDGKLRPNDGEWDFRD